LILGAEWLVRAAIRLAHGLNVRPLFVGLTAVALGSSAPQLAVTVQAAWSQTPDIAVSSVFGANIFSILVTLGLCALVIPLRVSRQLVRMDIPLMIGASLLVYLMVMNERLGRLEGALLVLALCGYLALLWRQSRHPGRPHHSQRLGVLWLSSLAMMATGVALLIGGGHLLLEAAMEIATDFGFSDRIIGLTIVAVGTSLPELATSLLAALRGQREIAVGNVIGSNLFNLLGVLGVTALIAPSPLSISPNALDFDLPVMLGVAVLSLPLFYSGYRITRVEGAILLGLYLAYGLHVVSFSTGMPLAGQLEQLMLHYVLPVLGALVLWGTVRAWRRQR